jgi:hypothetical protein
MTPKPRLGDRREQLRFEVAGQFWASIDLGEDAVLRNIGTGGVLVETGLTCLSTGIRGAQIAIDERGSEVTVIVRHVSPVTGSPNGGTRYLVGLEFVNVSPAQRVDIERLVDDWHERAKS